MEKINRLLYTYVHAYCTTNEVSFICYLANHQNFHGRVERLYYKDVTEALGCSNETFYTMLRDLGRELTVERDGMKRCQLIEVDWTNECYGYWNITLLNNEFRSYSDKLFHEDLNNAAKYPELAKALKDDVNLDKQSGYMRIKSFIFSPKFRILKPKTKKLGMLFTRFNSQEVSKRKLMAWIDIKKESTLLEILESLKQWYNIKIEGENVRYTIHKQYKDKNVSNKKSDDHTIEVNRLKSKLIAFMRGYKQYAKDGIARIAEDVAELYINYKKKILERKAEALSFFNRIIWCSIDERGIINAKYINKMLSDLFPSDEPAMVSVGAYNGIGNNNIRSTYKKPVSIYNKRKSAFSNFKNREYDSSALDEYLKCRDNPEYFEKNYGSKGITLEDLFKRCEKK